MTYKTKATLPKHKYGVKYNDPNYFKTKNKQYYQEIKADPAKSKASLFNYYKKKYGVHLVLNLIETLGNEQALNQLRLLKNDVKQMKNDNPFLGITLPILECY